MIQEFEFGPGTAAKDFGKSQFLIQEFIEAFDAKDFSKDIREQGFSIDILWAKDSSILYQNQPDHICYVMPSIPQEYCNPRLVILWSNLEPNFSIKKKIQELLAAFEIGWNLRPSLQKPDRSLNAQL